MIQDWDPLLEGLRRPGVPGLEAKYRCILALREQVGAGMDGQASRPILVALARRFPGSLRELDQRSLPDLHSRLALVLTLPESQTLPMWVRAQLHYHGFVHAALRLRPLLRGSDVDFAQVLAAYRPELDEPAAPSLDVAWLSGMARPREGRINYLAYEFVASQLGCSAAEVERLVFS